MLFRAFDPVVPPGVDAEVEDPYSGGQGGFTDALAIIERTASSLVAELGTLLVEGGAPGSTRP